MLKKIFLLLFKLTLTLIFFIGVYLSYQFYTLKKAELNSQLNNVFKYVLGEEKSSPYSISTTNSKKTHTITKNIEKSVSTKVDKKNLNQNPIKVEPTNLVKATKVKVEPILGIPNTKEGDFFSVDGPLWYDGTASLSKYNSEAMNIDIFMNATDKVFGYDLNLPFKLKDGKLNLSISLNKKSEGKYTLVIFDKNNNNSKQVQNVTEVEKNLGTSKELTFYSVQGATTFNVSLEGNISIKPQGVPFTLYLTKT